MNGLLQGDLYLVSVRHRAGQLVSQVLQLAVAAYVPWLQCMLCCPEWAAGLQAFGRT